MKRLNNRFEGAARQHIAASGLKEKFLARRWGAQSLICLYVSVLSGIVLALQYNPAEPFYSTSTIELVVPFGSFWRALHYYSSQAFFLLLLIHCAAILWKNDSRFSRSAWIRLTSSIPLGILLLFTGYVLRGDVTGEAAGAIAEHIALSIPFFGEPLNKLLFDIMTTGVQKVYANHLIGLMVMGGICVWPHLRRYTTTPGKHVLLLFLLIALSIGIRAPVEPDRFGLLHIAGPWFFLGLQELLHYLPAFWAGVIFPCLPITALYLLTDSGKIRIRLLWFLLFWLIIYILLSLISYSRI